MLASSVVVAADVADAVDFAEVAQAASDSPADVAPLLAQPLVRRPVPLPHFGVVLGQVLSVA